MAEIQMREERLKALEDAHRAKQQGRRQVVNPGFSSSGRPQSAARGGRRQGPPGSKTQTSMPTVETSVSNRSNGMVNAAFDDPEVTEVISNHTPKKTAKSPPQVLKVEVHQNDDLEEIPNLTLEAPTSSRSIDSNKTLTDELEDLKISEPEPKKAPKKKKKKPKSPPAQTPPDAPSPTTTVLSGGGLVREDTVLFPGDEYYRGDADLQPEKDKEFDDQSILETFQPVEPEVMAPDIRPLSRLSIQTTAGSAGIDDLENFVFQPAPQDEQIQCRITRDRHGIDNRAYPIYYLHLEREGMKKVFLLGARKRKKTTTSSYVISTDPTDVSRKNDSFVAKLRSNMMGTRFTCYDSGKAYSEPGALINPDNLRKEMVTIGYETNVLGFKGPRRMTIVVPGMDLDGERVECQPTHEKETLSAKLDSKSNENITTLHNKSPVWNEDSQSYVLNFHGRVTQASVKNFQIVHEKEPDYIVLQFGRIADDVFTMDYKYPLCAVQAFSIALSSFDNKLACE